MVGRLIVGRFSRLVMWVLCSVSRFLVVKNVGFVSSWFILGGRIGVVGISIVL